MEDLRRLQAEQIRKLQELQQQNQQLAAIVDDESRKKILQEQELTAQVTEQVLGRGRVTPLSAVSIASPNFALNKVSSVTANAVHNSQRTARKVVFMEEEEDDDNVEVSVGQDQQQLVPSDLNEFKFCVTDIKNRKMMVLIGCLCVCPWW